MPSIYAPNLLSTFCLISYWLCRYIGLLSRFTYTTVNNFPFFLDSHSESPWTTVFWIHLTCWTPIMALFLEFKIFVHSSNQLDSGNSYAIMKQKNHWQRLLDFKNNKRYQYISPKFVICFCHKLSIIIKPLLGLLGFRRLLRGSWIQSVNILRWYLDAESQETPLQLASWKCPNKTL